MNQMDKKDLKQVCFFIDYFLVSQIKKILGEKTSDVIVMKEEELALKQFAEPSRDFPCYGTYPSINNLEYLESYFSFDYERSLVLSPLTIQRETLSNGVYQLTVRCEPIYGGSKAKFCISNYVVRLVVEYREEK